MNKLFKSLLLTPLLLASCGKTEDVLSGVTPLGTFKVDGVVLATADPVSISVDYDSVEDKVGVTVIVSLKTNFNSSGRYDVNQFSLEWAKWDDRANNQYTQMSNKTGSLNVSMYLKSELTATYVYEIPKSQMIGEHALLAEVIDGRSGSSTNTSSKKEIFYTLTQNGKFGLLLNGRR